MPVETDSVATDPKLPSETKVVLMVAESLVDEACHRRGRHLPSTSPPANVYPSPLVTPERTFWISASEASNR